MGDKGTQDKMKVRCQTVFVRHILLFSPLKMPHVCCHLQTLITEKSYRSEEKFQDAEILASFHNFVIAVSH